MNVKHFLSKYILLCLSLTLSNSLNDSSNSRSWFVWMQINGDLMADFIGLPKIFNIIEKLRLEEEERVLAAERKIREMDAASRSAREKDRVEKELKEKLYFENLKKEQKMQEERENLDVINYKSLKNKNDIVQGCQGSY